MPAVLMSVAEAATELNVSRIAVKRVIARGGLKATIVGAGEWAVPGSEAKQMPELRILAQSLAEYVSRGAPDLAMPPTDRNWLIGERDFSLIEQLRAWVNDAASDQLEDQDRLNATYDAAFKSRGPAAMRQEGMFDDRSITLTPRVRTTLTGPLPDPGPYRRALSGQAATLTALEFAAVYFIRKAALRVLPEFQREPTLNELYRTPADYGVFAYRSYQAARAERLGYLRQQWKDTGFWRNLTLGEAIDGLLADSPLPAGADQIDFGAFSLLGRAGARLTWLAF